MRKTEGISHIYAIKGRKSDLRIIQSGGMAGNDVNRFVIPSLISNIFFIIFC